MPGLLPHVDPNGLLEFSVVYTDRALNHMSKRFGGVMTDISRMLKSVYKAHSVSAHRDGLRLITSPGHTTGAIERGGRGNSTPSPFPNSPVPIRASIGRLKE